MKTLITRKEIAQLTGLSWKTIKARERSLGLDKARADLGGQRVFYNTAKAIAALKARSLAT